MFPLFTDYFAHRHARAIPALPVLATALAAVILCSGSASIAFPLMVAMVAAIGMLFSGAPAGYLLLRLGGPLALAGAVFALKLFLTPGDVIWQAGIVTATREGLGAGMLISARVLGAVTALLCAGLLVPADRLIAELRRLGLPASVAEAALGIYRYIFLLIESAGTMIAARRVRLGYRNAWQGASSTGVVAGAVFLRAADQAQATGQAMQARAYRGGSMLPPLCKASKGEWLVAVTAGAAVTLVFTVTGGWG